MPRPAQDDPRLVRLTKLCLALPEATCERSGRHATFRVRTKTFAYFLDNHHGDGIVALAWRTARGENRDWVAAEASRVLLPRVHRTARVGGTPARCGADRLARGRGVRARQLSARGAEATRDDCGTDRVAAGAHEIERR